MEKRASTWPVIGHATVVAALQRHVMKGSIGHAYLLHGPRQIGKTTVAEQFAAALLCTAQDRAIACDECQSCRQRAAGVHPDFHLLLPTINSETTFGRPTITLEQVRQLQAALSHRPVLARRQVAIISGGDALQDKAANALLKTLEEPSGDTVLILTCDALEQLPLTVRSRCRQLRLSPVTTATISDALRAGGSSPSVARQIAALAAGRPGRAMQFAHSNDSRDAYVSGLHDFGQLVAGSLSDRLAAANAIQQRLSSADDASLAEGLQQQLELWQAAGRDRLLAAAGCPHLCQWAVDDAAASSPGQWRFFLDTLRDVRAALGLNASPRLALEVLLLSLPR
ncbi:MAG: DNA polymerase III subunit delta' [bacterium]|nr:DNA polymerase III subunit delta' [bacterium]